MLQSYPRRVTRYTSLLPQAQQGEAGQVALHCHSCRGITKGDKARVDDRDNILCPGCHEVERRAMRRGTAYTLERLNSLWIVKGGGVALMFPSEYDFAYSQFRAVIGSAS